MQNNLAMNFILDFSPCFDTARQELSADANRILNLYSVST